MRQRSGKERTCQQTRHGAATLKCGVFTSLGSSLKASPARRIPFAPTVRPACEARPAAAVRSNGSRERAASFGGASNTPTHGCWRLLSHFDFDDVGVAARGDLVFVTGWNQCPTARQIQSLISRRHLTRNEHNHSWHFVRVFEDSGC